MGRKTKRVLMLGGGPLQVPAICELKKMGEYVICLDYNPNAVGFRYADKAKIVSTLDVDAICEVYKSEKPDVIMTSTSDAPVRIISEVSQRLGIDCDLSYEDACAVTMKHLMRQRMKEHNLPIPLFRIIHNFDEFKDAYYNVFHKKCIIKPADNAGSRGVKLLGEVLDKDELFEEYEKCLEYSRNGIVMMEEIMMGAEVSVEALTVEGETYVISITDKIVCEKPYFVEIGHVEPSYLDEKMKEEIMHITKRLVTAMGVKNSPTHTEMIITADGPKIVEMAARLGGDFITSKLVPLSTGINMVRESVKLSLGMDVTLEKDKEQGAAIRFITSDKVGTVQNVNGIEAAMQQSGVKEVVLYVKKGDHINALRSSSDRIGHIIAVGKNRDEAWQYVQEAYKNIQITIK